MIKDALDGKIDLIITKNNHEERLKIRKKHSRLPHHHQKAQGKEGRMLLREGEHLDIRRQGRAPDYNNAVACAGGIKKHFRKLHVGTEKEVRRRKGLRAIQQVPRIRQRRKRRTCRRPGQGGDCPPHPLHVPRRQMRPQNSRRAHRPRHQNARRQGQMEPENRQGNTDKREIHRRRPAAEVIHR